LGTWGLAKNMFLDMLQKAKEAKNSLDAENFIYLPYRKIENESIRVKTLPLSFLSFFQVGQVRSWDFIHNREIVC
jgi:hypothetical protein